MITNLRSLNVLGIRRSIFERARWVIKDYHVAFRLCNEEQIALTANDVYSDDIDCLRPKLEPEEKVRLNEAINKQLRSMSMLPKLQTQYEGLFCPSDLSAM